MSRIALLMLSTLLLANCGIQRPLIAPKDIPKYEEQRRKRREQLEQDMKNYEEKTAPQAAPAVTIDPD